ncbi:MAG: rhamnogalacturonan acetylesterase [Spirochaetaceae bacterium]|nr:MAG: rhamnogalacturonan acetylesterase [Spirochaetaceae bacterium]
MKKHKITIYLAGDSTVASNGPETFPQAGWGQMISEFFTNDVVFENHAINGRSSKSFINEHRLEAIDQKIQKGDYILIQFGHNDPKPDIERHTEPDTTYKEFLKRYIKTARDHEAIPVLVTAVHRRRHDDSGRIINTHTSYHAAMKALATEEKVLLIDLGEKSLILFEKIGPSGTEKLFMHFPPQEYANYPEGKADNSHFMVSGAREIARLVAEEVKQVIPALADFYRVTNNEKAKTRYGK